MAAGTYSSTAPESDEGEGGATLAPLSVLTLSLTLIESLSPSLPLSLSLSLSLLSLDFPDFL